MAVDESDQTVPPLRLRMEQTVNFIPGRIGAGVSLKEAVASSTEAWIEASLTRLNLSLFLSSVSGLTAFVEDEVITPMVPLFISLRDVEVSLIEDRPLIRIGGPLPAPTPPLILRLKNLMVQRNQSGVVSVGVAKSSSSSTCYLFHSLLLSVR